MATNFYDREEKIFYDAENPCVYYGWHVSYNSGDLSICGFHIKEIKQEFIKAVGAALKKIKANDDGCSADASEIAACAFGMIQGEDEGDLLFDMILDIRTSDEDFGIDEAGKFWTEVLEPIAQEYNEKDNNARLETRKKEREG